MPNYQSIQVAHHQPHATSYQSADILPLVDVMDVTEPTEDHRKSLLFFLLSVVAQIVCILLSILYAKADITKDIIIGKAYYVYKIMLLIFMIVFSVIGLYCSKNFQSSQKGKRSPYTGFELLILFTSLGFYVYIFFSLIAGIGTFIEYNGSEQDEDHFRMYGIYVIILNIARFFHVYFQVIFMFQAISVKPYTAKLNHPQKYYYYTQVILFLIPFNFGFWLADSFIELKNVVAVSTIEAEYYGSSTWHIIVHLTYPMILFFRFNSFIHFIHTYFQT